MRVGIWNRRMMGFDMKSKILQDEKSRKDELEGRCMMLENWMGDDPNTKHEEPYEKATSIGEENEWEIKSN